MGNLRNPPPSNVLRLNWSNHNVALYIIKYVNRRSQPTLQPNRHSYIMCVGVPPANLSEAVSFLLSSTSHKDKLRSVFQPGDRTWGIKRTRHAFSKTRSEGPWRKTGGCLLFFWGEVFESPHPDQMQIWRQSHSGTLMHAHTNEGFPRAGVGN